MLGRAYAEQDCSIARALEVVGERWTLLILRDLSFGLRRFDELERSLGVAPGILASRLKRLAEDGMIERRRYQTAPERFEYQLTAKAMELAPVLFYFAKWGDRHYPSPAGPPRLSLHRGCGGNVDEHLACDRCGERVWFDQVDTAPRESMPAPG